MVTSLQQMNNLAATITNVVYNHQPGNKIHVTYWVALKKDGRNFAIGETVSAE